MRRPLRRTPRSSRDWRDRRCGACHPPSLPAPWLLHFAAHTVWAINVVRVFSAFSPVIRPRAGATLPLLMRALADEPGPFGRWLATILRRQYRRRRLRRPRVRADAVAYPARLWAVALSLNVIAGGGTSTRTAPAPARGPLRRRRRRRYLAWQPCGRCSSRASLGRCFGVSSPSSVPTAVLYVAQHDFRVMLAVTAGIAVGGAAAGHSSGAIATPVPGYPRYRRRRPGAPAVLPMVPHLTSAAQMSPMTARSWTTLTLAFPIALLSGGCSPDRSRVPLGGPFRASATAWLTIANTIGGAAGSV